MSQWIVLVLMALTMIQDRSNADEKASPLVMGETFSIPSQVLGETRRINVYLPPGYAGSSNDRFPVLYLMDGGIAEDFLHIAGLVQVSVGNGTIRPIVLVGVENTERRRDLTGPTEVASDRKIAARVGGSGPFRKFLRDELIPQVNARYRTTSERAIVGESLAGLFVVETLLNEPDLFDIYLAVDPSLWWNNEAIVRAASPKIRDRPVREQTFYLGTSDERGIVEPTQRLAEVLAREAHASLHWHHEPMPSEKHSTIFHPAALKAFREVFPPKPAR